MGSLRRELLFILLAAFFFFGIGSAGAGLLAGLSVRRDGGWFGDSGIAMMVWIQWGGKIIGRFCGDSIAGFLLGRYVRRINPMYIVAGFLALPIGVLVFSQAVQESWRFAARYVGIGGATLQLVVQILMMSAAVSLGIWLGRRSLIGTACRPTSDERHGRAAPGQLR